MKYTKPYIATLILFLSLFQTAVAGTITLIDDNRRVENYSSDGNSILLPSAPYADFDVFGQTSTIGTSSFTGRGRGTGYSDVDFFITETFFDVSFSITDFVDIDLSGYVYSEDGAFGSAQSGVSLYAGTDLSDPLLYSYTSDGTLLANEAIGYVDTLSTGDYRLRFFTDQVPSETFANWEFSATFSEDFATVPVPAAFWLFTSGLLGLIAVSRKKV